MTTLKLDLDWADAVAQADLVHRGDISPTELVESAIARIEARNPPLNAVITTAFDRALELSHNVDLSAPLAGVPFLLKDQVDWAGVRTTQGSRFLESYVPEANSPILDRWLGAGLIPLGKTNVPECGLLGTTEPVAYGATSNPWGAGRTAGGSSGGSAAAVAAGMVAVATASDGGGSIRIPAAACGVFGLKPTRGRNPGTGWGGLSVTHVVTRSVRDSAALLDVSCGPVLGDPASLPTPSRPFLEELDQRPARLTIAVSTEAYEGVRYAPEVIEAVHRTAALLTELGHTVVPGRPDLSPSLLADLMPRVGRIVPAATAKSVDNWASLTGRPLDRQLFEPLTWKFIEMGRDVSGAQLLDAFDAQQQLAAAAAAFFVAHDAWLLPALGEVPPENGTWQFPEQDPMWAFLRMSMFIPPLSTALANYTGQPAVSVPLETDGPTGLPIGVQIYGRWGEDGTLLRLSRQLEEARPWAGRRP